MVAEWWKIVSQAEQMDVKIICRTYWSADQGYEPSSCLHNYEMPDAQMFSCLQLQVQILLPNRMVRLPLTESRGEEKMTRDLHCFQPQPFCLLQRCRKNAVTAGLVNSVCLPKGPPPQ